jgi:hypothetical protein
VAEAARNRNLLQQDGSMPLAALGLPAKRSI